MKKIISVIISLLIAKISYLGATDDCREVVISASTGYESEYVYRGSKNAGASFQPSLQLNFVTENGEIYGGVWNNYPFNRVNSIVAVESDPYFGYKHYLGEIFYADFGYIYNWKVKPPVGVLGHSSEIYTGLSGNVMLNPSVYGYYDFDKRQWTLESSIGYSFDLNEFGARNTSFDVGLIVGILRAKSAYGALRPRRNGYVYLASTFDIVYHFNDTFNFRIGVRYAANKDKSGGVANDVGHHIKMFWWGAGLFMQY